MCSPWPAARRDARNTGDHSPIKPFAGSEQGRNSGALTSRAREPDDPPPPPRASCRHRNDFVPIHPRRAITERRARNVAAMPRQAVILLLLALAAVMLVVLGLSVPAAVIAASWAWRVRGGVTRAYDFDGRPFAAGRHRGADLTAPPGTPVRAPCTGRVVVAARIGTSGGVFTVACPPWRASVLPLARIDVRRGAHVDAGARVGASGRSRIHAGVHLGIRRAGDPEGYVDPLQFLPAARRWPPVGPPPATRELRRRPRVGPGPRMAPAPRPAPAPRWAPGPRRARAPRSMPAPQVAPGPRPTTPPRPAPASRNTPAPSLASPPRASPARAPLPAAEPTSPPLAPWPVWAGLALLLAGTSGGAVRVRRRTHSKRGPEARAIVSEVG